MILETILCNLDSSRRVTKLQEFGLHGMIVKNRGPRGKLLAHKELSKEFLRAIQERKHLAPDIARLCGFVRKERVSYVVKTEIVLGRLMLLADAIGFPHKQMFYEETVH